MKKILFSLLIYLFIFSEHATAQNITVTGSTPNARKLKYPVVLVHGIARNDSNKNMHAWGSIPDTLAENGIEVYFGNTDAWGGILTNAELLKETIDAILEGTSHEKVNIIAHSKGGIDSRYCIWKYDYGDKVASLTTFSTPHQGAEIADLFYNTKIIHSKSVKKRLATIGKMFGDINPDIYNVNFDLTTENMNEFNANITMDNRVYFQSVYSTMSNPFDDPLFFRTYAYIKNLSGENDGLVSNKSASWGNNPKKLQDSISHEQIIDHGKRKNATITIQDIYLSIIDDLGKKGY